MSFVILDPTHCPDCGTELGEHGFMQPALFIGAGYGHSQHTTVAACPQCGWTITRAVQTVTPVP